MLEPVIKWSGSKRFQAAEIVARMGDGYDTYYEPFCGGCSVLYYILNNCPEKFKRFVCNDLNGDLISTYNRIMTDWKSIYLKYDELWHELNKDSGLERVADIERKKKMFLEVRENMNNTHDPELFFFIMRTTVNGMPRYNSQGKFNNTLHVTRNGMVPEKVATILERWSILLNKYNVQFLNKSYDEITDVKENDFMYFDPPYSNIKGMYFGAIDYEPLWKYIRKLPCDYLLSFDGVAGEENNIYSVPKDVYNEHVLLNNGNSSFRRVVGNSKDTVVQESLYVKVGKGANKNDDKRSQ